MRFKFGMEDARILWRELNPLIDEHTIELRGENSGTRPDVGYYNDMAKRKDLLLFTVRHHQTGVLVGYSSFFLVEDNQRSGEVCAHQDAIFISKEYRKGLTGYKFIQYIEQEIAAMGVNTIYQAVTPRVDFVHLLVRLGYQEATTIYSKRLN